MVLPEQARPPAVADPDGPGPASNGNPGSYGSVVELRVHGVSGTPPEELLDRQLVRQVAGNKTAGFYRPRLREEWRDRPSNDPGSDARPYAVGDQTLPPPLLEGYSWGGLTSGSPSRALWLILLPFTLINVAPRMRPVPGKSPQDHPRRAWWVWYLCRLMAISVTVTMTLGGVGVGLGIFAWQCGRPGACDDLRWPLSAMFVDASPGWRIAWGTVLPLLVLGVLALLSWRNSVQYDLIRPIAMTAPVNDESEVGSEFEPRLAHPSFWYGRYPVSRLRHLHLQAGVGSIGVALVLAATSSPMRVAGLMLAGVLGGLVLVALGWPGLLRRQEIPGDDADGVPSRSARNRNTGWILLIWIPAAAILLVGLLAPHGSNGVLNGEMGGYDELITVWFTGQSVLAVAMIILIATMAMAESPRTPRRAMSGMGTAVMTILGLYLAAALTAGLVILSAAWVSSSTPWITIGDVQAVLAGTRITVPASLSFAGAGTFVVAVIVVATLAITVGYVLLMWSRSGTRDDRAAAAAAAEQARTNHPRRFRQQKARTIKNRTTSIARSYWLARRADYLPDFLAELVLSIGTVGAALTMTYGLLGTDGLSGNGVGQLFGLPSLLGVSVADAVAVGAWLTGVFAVGLVVLGALAFRVPKTRKAIGILWDIGSFWPRDVHPLAPPCYAERAVPEIAMRLTAHAALVTGDQRAEDREDATATAPMPGLVVLAGHSQGTVLSMAALMGPGRSAAGRTALLTFGTVLRRLYARCFPLYFSAGAFAALSRRLGDTSTADANARAADAVTGDRPGPPDRGTEAGGPSPWGRNGAGVFPKAVRWRNLWRRTDYLGGRILHPLSAVEQVAAVQKGARRLDVELVDPLFLPVPGDTTLPAAGRHSNFTRDPAFQRELMVLVRDSFATLDRRAPGPATGTRSRPPGHGGPVTTMPRLDPRATDELMNPRESMI